MEGIRNSTLGPLVERAAPKLERAGFLLSCLLSARHGRLNRQMIGHTLELTTDVVTRQMVTSYAAATTDDNPRYREEHAMAPPLLISRLVLPLLRKLLMHPDLHLNVLRMVHAQQELRWHAPIHVGDRLRLTLRISDVRDTPAGELLELRGEGYRGDKLLGEAIAGVMVRGKRRSARGRSSGETGQRPEIFRLSMPTTSDQATRYAEASGDDNFIHTNELVARLAGLPRTILHGMCVLAMSCATITNARLDGDLSRLAGLRARFSRPAFPGQTLTLVGYDGEPSASIGFEVLGPRGERVIKQGEVTLA